MKKFKRTAYIEDKNFKFEGEYSYSSTTDCHYVRLICDGSEQTFCLDGTAEIKLEEFIQDSVKSMVDYFIDQDLEVKIPDHLIYNFSNKADPVCG